MNFLELSRERYSCRAFSGKKVENELIEKIIDAGITAPTAVNKQPYRIFRITSEDGKESIRKSTKFDFGADEFLVVGAKCDEGWVRKFDGTNFSVIDASIVATQMMLQIAALGLGTTWVGYFDAPLLKELCPCMKDYELIAIFPIGYPADKPSERHFERRSKEETVITI